MRRCFVLLFLCLPNLAHAGMNAPPIWSPDGRWIAFTVAGQMTDPGLKEGWIFGKTGDRSVQKVEDSERPTLYRIYAADRETGTAVVLEESRHQLTSPGWSPDGRAITFGRLVQDWSTSTHRFEVVVQDSPRKSRVLISRAIPANSLPKTDFSSDCLTWSPDGRYITVPGFGTPPSLIVIRADNGRTVKTIERADLPAWSPDGSKLAFIKHGKTASVEVTDSSFNSTRPLLELVQSDQVPVWSRDSRSLLAVRTRTIESRRGLTEIGLSQQVDLIRVHIDTGSEEVAVNLSTEPVDVDRAIRGATFTIDRNGEELFWSLDSVIEPPAIVRHQPKVPMTVERFNPVDISVKIASIAVSPNGKTLVIRFGPSPCGATTAFYDVESKELKPIASNESGRSEWLALLLRSARSLLELGLTPVAPARETPERPTIFPLPGELGSNDEIQLRLSRLGRLGRPLCVGPANPKVETFVSEARLAFDTLRGDYSSALTSLDAVENQTSSSDAKLRLLGLRAQLHLGLGETECADYVVSYLKSIDDQKTMRYEVTSAGAALFPESSSSQGWVKHLAGSLDRNTGDRPSTADVDNETLTPHLTKIAGSSLRVRPLSDQLNGRANGPIPQQIEENIPDNPFRFRKPSAIPPPPVISPPLPR